VTRLLKLTLTAALVLVATLGLAATAGAADRNRDRIPDRWEKRNGLSLKVNQARRDQDRDGLKNRGEFKARTDPRDPDSDEDGVDDGDEQAGTITTVAGEMVTITLFAGGTVTGRVTDDTDIECETPDDAEQGAREDDDDDESGGGDDDEGDDDDDRARMARGGDDDDDECEPSALAVGAVVHEAELELTSDGASFTELELLIPAGATAPPAGSDDDDD
jgi:hypothetical protein